MLSALTLRKNEPEDFKFIINSWLKSYRNSSPCVHISNIPYYSFHGEIVEKYLKEYNTLVLYDKENDNIIGYIVYKIGQGIWVAYVYVKYPFRKMGLMKHMLKAIGIEDDTKFFITHIPKDYNRFRKSFKCEYIPYIGV